MTMTSLPSAVPGPRRGLAERDAVGRREEVHRLEDAVEFAAGDQQVAGDGRADGQDDGVVAAAQLLAGDVSPDVDPAAEAGALGLHLREPAVEDRLLHLGKALVGIWYETIALMQDATDKGRAARDIMAKLSGTDLAGFDSQLKTTKMFYTAKDALGFMSGSEMSKTMDLVRTFSFEHNLLGEKVKSKDVIGISMPAANLGSRQNVKLRFDPTYMKLAADGKL